MDKDEVMWHAGVTILNYAPPEMGKDAANVTYAGHNMKLRTH